MKRRVTHTVNGTTGDCLGVRVMLWCPGCDRLHQFVFKCPEHGKPTGPVWEGDPWSDPPDFPPTPSSSNSLATHWYSKDKEGDLLCHSFVKHGQWEFLGDCTAHDLRGFHDLVDLPDWLEGEEYERV